ncbi:Basic-leucine zipper domain [Phytophthora cactorum]|nr:Basic-leucine zipper domain [Phytophthora cactorum]
MSGIDWSILRTARRTPSGGTTQQRGRGHKRQDANIAADNAASDILSLDDIEIDRMMAGAPAMGQLQMTKGQAVGGVTTDGQRRVERSLAGGAVVRGSAVLAVQADVNFCEKKRGSSTSAGQSAWKSSYPKTRAKSKASASKSKRPLKRKKSGPASPTAADSGGEDDLEKKQMRRVKNLVSVREFRKRKTKQLEQNEARLRRLEAENMDLKMRLKIGKEAILSEQREKKQIKEQMREMLQRNANEQEIAQFLNMYKVTYSDYGQSDARSCTFICRAFVTKLSLYSVEQGVDMLRRDHVIKEDPMSAPESATATMSLWGILADELEVSDEQQRQILERRAAIKKVRDDLNHTLSIVKKLEEVTDEKNTALEAQVAQLQQILTPSQATKFIIWVKENPAFMYMLDKLVDSTLQNNTNSAEE